MSEVIVSFSTDQEGLSAITALATVGRIYEVAINGAGYMLYDGHAGEDQDLRYIRETVPLDAERLSTTETPFSENVQRYSFKAWSDWRGGSGQRFQDRESSLANAFKDSSGIDPFSNDNELTLLTSTSRELATAYTAVRLAVVGDVLYAQTGAKQFTYVSTPGGAETAFSVAAATTIVDVDTDGQSWYAAAGTAGIFKGTTADPGAKWDTLTAGTDVRVVSWAGQRVCAAYLGAASSTPNVFTTFTSAGAEEVASGRLILPVGWTITSITDGNGYVFFSAHSGNVGVIYAWQVGSSSAPFVALRMSPGHLPRSVRWYQGNVMVWATDDTRMVAYRCVPADTGQLTPTFAFELTGYSGGYAVGGWVGDEALVFWPRHDAAAAGLGAFNLETGGYCNWIASTVAGVVRSVARWQGRLVFGVDGDGVWSENPSAYVTSGWVTTSVTDSASSLDKIYDSLNLVVEPLLTNESVDVAYALDGSGVTYTAWAAATITGAGLKRKTTELGVKAPSVTWKFTLNGPGTSRPKLYVAQMRFHAHGLADTIVQLPIDCGDNVADLRGVPLAENGPGAGAARARTLEQLTQARVVFQDRDYPVTATTETWEVVRVQVRSTAIWDRKAARNMLRDVAVVTMRKLLK